LSREQVKRIASADFPPTVGSIAII
jgi:hypothetical protein